MSDRDKKWWWGEHLSSLGAPTEHINLEEGQRNIAEKALQRLINAGLYQGEALQAIAFALSSSDTAIKDGSGLVNEINKITATGNLAGLRDAFRSSGGDSNKFAVLYARDLAKQQGKIDQINLENTERVIGRQQSFIDRTLARRREAGEFDDTDPALLQAQQRVRDRFGNQDLRQESLYRDQQRAEAGATRGLMGSLQAAGIKGGAAASAYSSQAANNLRIRRGIAAEARGELDDLSERNLRIQEDRVERKRKREQTARKGIAKAYADQSLGRASKSTTTVE